MGLSTMYQPPFSFTQGMLLTNLVFFGPYLLEGSFPKPDFCNAILCSEWGILIQLELFLQPQVPGHHGSAYTLSVSPFQATCFVPLAGSLVYLHNLIWRRRTRRRGTGMLVSWSVTSKTQVLVLL